MIKIKRNKNWRNKPQPYWFANRYPTGTWTIQVMALEIFGSNSWRNKRRAFNELVKATRHLNTARETERREIEYAQHIYENYLSEGRALTSEKVLELSDRVEFASQFRKEALTNYKNALDIYLRS